MRSLGGAGTAEHGREGREELLHEWNERETDSEADQARPESVRPAPSSPEDRRRSAEAGFDLHLVKPLDYELERALANLGDYGGGQRIEPAE